MASPVPTRLRALARELEQRFIGKDEVIRLLLISVVAGEHAVLIGPPGTAKSALIRSLREHITKPEFRTTYKVRVGDIVLWDNFGTVHCASPIEYSN